MRWLAPEPDFWHVRTKWWINIAKLNRRPAETQTVLQSLGFGNECLIMHLLTDGPYAGLGTGIHEQTGDVQISHPRWRYTQYIIYEVTDTRLMLMPNKWRKQWPGGTNEGLGFAQLPESSFCVSSLCETCCGGLWDGWICCLCMNPSYADDVQELMITRWSGLRARL